MLVTVLGLLGVLSAELAVRISPVTWSTLAMAGMVFPLSWGCLVTGVVGSLYHRRWRSFRWGLLVKTTHHSRHQTPPTQWKNHAGHGQR